MADGIKRHRSADISFVVFRVDTNAITIVLNGFIVFTSFKVQYPALEIIHFIIWIEFN
jgi:hypothetical protein